MLRLGGFVRCLILLGAVVVASIVYLFAPLLVRHTVTAGVWAGLIVLALWTAQWMFVRRRQARHAATGPPPEARVVVPGKPAGPGDAPEPKAPDASPPSDESAQAGDPHPADPAEGEEPGHDQP